VSPRRGWVAGARRAGAVAAVLGLAAVAGCGADEPSSETVVVTDIDDTGEFDHDYLIPLGTAAQIDAGVEVEIVPEVLEVEVGDSIRIVNEDTEGHVVGVFYVGAGETLTQRFDSPGTLSGECSVHPSGTFTLRVVEA
jgi:hypothetical protein